MDEPQSPTSAPTEPPARYNPRDNGGFMNSTYTISGASFHITMIMLDWLSRKMDKTHSAPAPVAAPVCAQDQQAFMDCLAANQDAIAPCQQYFDALTKCRQQSDH